MNNTTVHLENYIGAQEAASILNVTRATINNWTHSGKLGKTDFKFGRETEFKYLLGDVNRLKE